MNILARPRAVARTGRTRCVSVRAVASVPVPPAGPKPDPFAKMETYNDNIADQAFIKIFTDKMADKLGVTPTKTGFDGFVEVSRYVMKGRNSDGQRAIVRDILMSLLPPNAPQTFRMLFPPNQWSAEINAQITTKFFAWLVGPCTVEEVDVKLPDGTTRRQASLVQIKKCRYLEQAGCVGMCVNMCKRPTEDFFTNDFGIPVSMTPNFEDLSCKMVFGQLPTPIDGDPIYNQPCFTRQCSIAPPTELPCPKIRA